MGDIDEFNILNTYNNNISTYVYTLINDEYKTRR